jgi:hypothetical protein
MKILIVQFSLVQKGEVQWQRERETGGWAQFDWMLDGGSLEAQPIEFWQFCFLKKPIDVSPLINLYCYCILAFTDISLKEHNYSKKC